MNNEFKQKELIQNQNRTDKEDIKLSPLKKEEKIKINNFYKKLLEWF